MRYYSKGQYIFFFSSRRRHTRWPRDWSSDVCSSDLAAHAHCPRRGQVARGREPRARSEGGLRGAAAVAHLGGEGEADPAVHGVLRCHAGDRKSTRLNSSHVAISYAVFCLKKKKNTRT